ncbi:unnamed protein product [Symbiodinium sp. CCMP2456]|nr:unnamed protein product [Symbiodinium sp. CCMP2456]
MLFIMVLQPRDMLVPGIDGDHDQVRRKSMLQPLGVKAAVVLPEHALECQRHEPFHLPEDLRRCKNPQYAGEFGRGPWTKQSVNKPLEYVHLSTALRPGKACNTQGHVCRAMMEVTPGQSGAHLELFATGKIAKVRRRFGEESLQDKYMSTQLHAFGLLEASPQLTPKIQAYNVTWQRVLGDLNKGNWMYATGHWRTK